MFLSDQNYKMSKLLIYKKKYGLLYIIECIFDNMGYAFNYYDWLQKKNNLLSVVPTNESKTTTKNMVLCKSYRRDRLGRKVKARLACTQLLNNCVTVFYLF